MKLILVCMLSVIFVGAVSLASGQDRRREEKGAASADQIEVKPDRFSGVTTVTLKPQAIVDKPDHQVTMEIKTKTGEKKHFEWETDKVNVRFKSQSKDLVDFGDKQLHFIVDGKKLDLGECAGGPPAFIDPDEMKPGFKILHSYTSVLEILQLEQISKGNRVEMRLGALELTLSQPVLALLREYTNQVTAQQKNMGRKP